MRKFRLYFDKDKEEAWLNEMCGQGWAMTGFFLGIYTFEPCEPGKYTYQIDMPAEIGKGKIKDQATREYIDFVESTGAEYVCTWAFWVIFRKETAKGEFKLYTDAESQIRLYQRIRWLFFIVGILEFCNSFSTTCNFIGYVTRNMDAIHGNILKLDGSMVWIACLGILYLICLVFLVMIIRLSTKIRRLKRENC